MLDKRILALVRIGAWILVTLLIVVTLVPIGFRPVVTANPSIERIAAYVLAGLLMTMGYPRHWLCVLLGGVILVGGLEAAQNLTSTRHGRLDDFLVKAGATLVGDLVGLAVASWTGWRLTQPT